MKLLPLLLFPIFAILFNPVAHPPEKVISCAPAKTTFRVTITSVQSGNWSEPATWGGRVPAAGDAITISAGHTVFANADASVAGMQIAGLLIFDASRSVTISSTKNILVTGLLNMTPPSPAVIHTIKFTGINENTFVGSGMDPIDSDIGLWVMGGGRLQLQGADKTSWTNANISIPAGGATITVDDATGWQIGDEVVITATSAGSANYDLRNIKKVTDNIVDFSSTTTAHPMINNQWTAEVGNLTRNVRIEGAATGRSHIFIRSTSRQLIKNVAFRYLGPRKDQNSDKINDLILGRYGLHFHHCMDGSDGSVVEGCVMRDIGNHAYVPHVSNGIEMRDNIAYNCTETPFWWDIVDVSHRTSWVHNLVVQPVFTERSRNFDTDGSPTLGTNGFVLGRGDDNRCDSNVVAGQTGLETTNAAYDWEETDFVSVWGFKGNLAHNCTGGIRVWQNAEDAHVIENTTIYNCKIGALHGAYQNNYIYSGGTFYNAVFEDHAASSDNAVRIENITMDGAGKVPYPFVMFGGPGKGVRPVFMRACTIKGGTKGAILDSTDQGNKCLDVIQSNITGTIKVASNAVSSETIRVQPASGQAYKITKAGQSNISAFAPTSWGSGAGLLGQYYNGTIFTNLAETRIDPIVNYVEWNLIPPGQKTGVHQSITSESYSVRWTGYIEPQFSESYKFSVQTGGGVRLWVNGYLLVEKWQEMYPTNVTSTPINLIAGKSYAIQIDYFNNDNRSIFSLKWQSASQPLQVVPQTQLYPGEVITPDPPTPPANQSPSASAGQDETINLQFTLNGSGSDPDGTIVSYKWEQVSGPSCNIIMLSSTSAIVKNLQPGTYVFRLTVTDDKGATGSATVTKIVQ